MDRAELLTKMASHVRYEVDKVVDFLVIGQDWAAVLRPELKKLTEESHLEQDRERRIIGPDTALRDRHLELGQRRLRLALGESLHGADDAAIRAGARVASRRHDQFPRACARSRIVPIFDPPFRGRFAAGTVAGNESCSEKEPLSWCFVVPPLGLEPRTNGLKVRCSNH